MVERKGKARKVEMTKVQRGRVPRDILKASLKRPEGGRVVELYGVAVFVWPADGMMPTITRRWIARGGKDCVGPVKHSVAIGITSTYNVPSGLGQRLQPRKQHPNLPRRLLRQPRFREVGTHREQLPTKPASHLPPRTCLYKPTWGEFTK